MSHTLASKTTNTLIFFIVFAIVILPNIVFSVLEGCWVKSKQMRHGTFQEAAKKELPVKSAGPCPCKLQT